ncbi:MAG: hypothetical protein RL172_3077 [Bacteroidota bacterium]|jgi:hypothetical protein
MINFTATIQKFDKQGEKTGWTFIEIPEAVAAAIKPGYKKSFKVKGKLDACKIAQVTILPMGGGVYILPLNATMRKAIGKSKGATINAQLQEDAKGYELNAALMSCLADEPEALVFFNSKPPSHQRYYSKWIDSAKTTATQTKRIALVVTSLLKKMDFGEMLRSQKSSAL